MRARRAVTIVVGLTLGWLLAFALAASTAVAQSPSFDGTITVWSSSEDLDFDVWPLGGAGQTITRRVTLSVTASQPYELTVRMAGDQLVVESPAASYQLDPDTGYPLRDALGNNVYEYGYNLGALLPAAKMSFAPHGTEDWTALSSVPVTIGAEAPSGTPQSEVYSLVFRIESGADLGWDVLAGAYTNDLAFELVPTSRPPSEPESTLADVEAGTESPAEEPEETEEAEEDEPTPPDTASQEPEQPQGAVDPEPTFRGPAEFTDLVPTPAGDTLDSRPKISVKVHDPAGLQRDTRLCLFLDGVAREVDWAYRISEYRDVYLEEEDRWTQEAVYDTTSATLAYTPDEDLASGAHSVHVGVASDDAVSTCDWWFTLSEPGADTPEALVPIAAMISTPTIEVTGTVMTALSAEASSGLGRLLWVGPTVLAPASPEDEVADLTDYSLQLWAGSTPVGMLLPTPEGDLYVHSWNTAGFALGEQRLYVMATRTSPGAEPVEPGIVLWERWVILQRAEVPQ